MVLNTSEWARKLSIRIKSYYLIKYKDETPVAFFSKSPRAAVRYTRYRDDGTIHGDLLNAIAGEI